MNKVNCHDDNSQNIVLSSEYWYCTISPVCTFIFCLWKLFIVFFIFSNRVALLINLIFILFGCSSAKLLAFFVFFCVLIGDDFCCNVVIIEMRGEYGYLSAIDWPLLPVSRCIVHLILYIYFYILISDFCYRVNCIAFTSIYCHLSYF